MSEPLISPWLIYLVSVCDNISSISMALSIMFGVATAYCGVGLVLETNEKFRNKLVTTFKITLCAVVMSLTAVLFVPTKEIAISMVIANVITRENINITKNEILSLITDVKNIIDGNKDDKKDIGSK